MTPAVILVRHPSATITGSPSIAPRWPHGSRVDRATARVGSPTR